LLVPLTKGRYTLIDEDSYELISNYKWRFSKGYAISDSPRIKGVKHDIKLHRLIINAPKNKDVDHINGDTLDNRKCNLRLCTPSQNGANMKKTLLKCSSEFKGVCWNKRKNFWQAYINKDYKRYALGYFENERHAAMARDIWAKELFGDFAKLNFTYDRH